MLIRSVFLSYIDFSFSWYYIIGVKFIICLVSPNQRSFYYNGVNDSSRCLINDQSLTYRNINKISFLWFWFGSPSVFVWPKKTVEEIDIWVISCEMNKSTKTYFNWSFLSSIAFCSWWVLWTSSAYNCSCWAWRN